MDLDALRAEFPALHQEVNGRSLVYLDNAATTQKPQRVLDAMAAFYACDNANVHRGLHTLSERATTSFEAARVKLQRLINASTPREIVLTRGTTEAINLVAQSFVRPRLGAGDAVLISAMEHHSNIVPWQLVCDQVGAELRVIPVNDRGELRVEKVASLLDERVRLLAIGHVSNALGTINPVSELIALARQHDVPVLLDGAQAVAHMAVDVQALDCDFYCFSGHKMYGPTGIGVLYGKLDRLESMPPWQGGGDMIETVRFEGSVYSDVPARFEAGTPHIAGAVGLGEAAEFLMSLDWDLVKAHEQALLAEATDALSGIEGLRIIGTAAEKVGVISFVLPEAHPQDIGTILDEEGIAVRAGHHCAQPLLRQFGLPATARASFAVYNSSEEVQRLAAALRKLQSLFR